MNVSNQRQKNHHKRILAAENLSNMTQAMKVITITGGCVAFGAAFIIAVILDRAAGHYECRECYHHFQPTITAYLLGVRSPTKRYLRCPKCRKYSYCRVELDEII